MLLRRGISILATLLIAMAIAPALPAVSEPATTVKYPAGATTTRFTGLAFDTCTAPTVAQMKAWRASPYRAVGVYIGGPNRTCAQPELTATWVSEVSKLKWRIVPIYMGRQAPCTFRGARSVNITPSKAAAQGTASAADAVAKAKALGILPGSAIYGDMEHYEASDSACRTTVLRYLSAWTKELHRLGYVSGVYAHLNSGAKHLSDAYTSTSYARPDALWIARWDGNSSLSGWPGIANSKWAAAQRGKQYRGDHNETHGGVTLNIDSDRFDAPVATVGYRYKVTSSTPLNARSGPTTKDPVVRTHAPGSNLTVVCQLPGSKVGTTSVWDKLSNGTYVTDRYVSTPSNTGYSSPLPRCLLPYQVTAARQLNTRAGPSAAHKIVGSLPSGAIARVHCQKTGSTYRTTSIWDRLSDGNWVTDYYVASPSSTTFSKPIPRC
jgi:uncharacterized protein YraI